MSKKGFMSFNSLANYYSKVNKWDQDKIQEFFLGMISNCDLTKEQVDKIGINLIVDNASIGGFGKNSGSIERFNVIKESLVIEPVWIEERTR